MTNDCETTVKNALELTGFRVPAADECVVLLFDSAAWSGIADSAKCWLSVGERNRLERFRFERDRTTYVLAHACWRIVLGVAMGVETHEVPFTMTSSGQPTLPGTGMATSLSHADSWVAIAIAKTCTIGIDIECSLTRRALDRLIDDICTPDEIVYQRKLPLEDREASLLALWTRKEALLKAFGIGLRAEPSSISANPDTAIMPPSMAPVRTPCKVRNILLPAKLVGALASPADAVGKWRLCRLDESQAIDTVFG